MNLPKACSKNKLMPRTHERIACWKRILACIHNMEFCMKAKLSAWRQTIYCWLQKGTDISSLGLVRLESWRRASIGQGCTSTQKESNISHKAVWLLLCGGTWRYRRYICVEGHVLTKAFERVLMFKRILFFQCARGVLEAIEELRWKRWKKNDPFSGLLNCVVQFGCIVPNWQSWRD